MSLLQHGQTERRHKAADGEAVTKVLKAKVSFNSSSSRNPCPTVTPLGASDGFSLEEYVRASWYAQAQQTLAYQQSPSSFNCVVATYEDLGSVSGDITTIPFYCDGAIAVYNYCGGDGCGATLVNGVPRRFLCAAYPDQTKAALRVVPCGLPELLAGNYWVVAVGVDGNSHYEWALVSGGQPTILYSDGGCTTNSGPLAYFDAGLWILSRTPIVSPTKLLVMENTAVSLGYTTSQLQPVTQGSANGCTYVGAYIKA